MMNAMTGMKKANWARIATDDEPETAVAKAITIAASAAAKHYAGGFE